MKFNKLRIKRFRQFYEEQTIDFSTNNDKNITIIHGGNGSGKSTILNAFLWVFYKEIDLPKSHDLVSEKAVAEADYGDTIEAEVEVVFEHEGDEYRAKRSGVYQKTSEGGMMTEKKGGEITLEVSGEERENPDITLRRVLPERLKELFLFHGENIDELSGEDNQDQIKNAIRNIMGLEILERSIDHLEKVSTEFRKEVQEYGGEDINALIDELEDLEREKTEKEKELKDVKEKLSEIDKDIDGVESELAELQGLEDKKDRKEDLERERGRIRSEIEDIEDEINTKISDDGYTVFAVSAVQETLEGLQEEEKEEDEEEDEDEIEVDRKVVNALLEEGTCICGRDIEENSEHFKRVEQLIASDDSDERGEIETVRSKTNDRIKDVISDRRDLFRYVERKLDKKEKLSEDLKGVNEEIDDIEEKLSEGDTERVEELEKKKEELGETEDKYDRKQGILEKEIEGLEEDINEKESEIDEKKSEKEQVEVAKRRKKVAETAKESLQETFETYQDTVRESVNSKVNEIFRDIIAKDYYVDITENYELRTKKDVGDESSVSVAKSTGERQVASLSFIASLISIARDRYESDKETSYFEGGIYPIVMDSPFGYLDPEYQRKVSETMPKMSEQVIVLVTDSQWSDEVRGEMEEKIGKEYRLDYRDPREDDVQYEQTKIKPERANIKEEVR